MPGASVNSTGDRTSTLLTSFWYRWRITSEDTLRQLAAWGVAVHGRRVVDLGCGSGGGTLALAQAGARAHGVDRDREAIAVAQQQTARLELPATFAVDDIMELPPSNARGQADLVVLQEVVEHVHDVERVLRAAAAWLKPEGSCVVTFPPFYSPAGGHHHRARVPFRYVPWLHLMVPRSLLVHCLPNKPAYREEVRTLNRMTIARFESTATKTGWRLVRRAAYLIRPSISTRTTLPTLQGGWLVKVPGLRELLITGVEYLLRRDGAR